MTTNDGELAHAWALQGAGLVLKSIWDVKEDIAAGRVTGILSTYRIEEWEVIELGQQALTALHHVSQLTKFEREVIAHQLWASVPAEKLFGAEFLAAFKKLPRRDRCIQIPSGYFAEVRTEGELDRASSAELRRA